MRRLTLTALLGFGMLTASCATPTPRLAAAPRVEMPAEAAKACSLYLLPAAPTQADLEIGYTIRGAEIVSCEGARALAVQIHTSEHDLEDRVTSKGRPPSH